MGNRDLNACQIKYLDKMEFDLTRESNLTDEFEIAVSNLTSRIQMFFIYRDYGDSIKTYLIGIICVKPEFDRFFKVRKPKYEALVKVKSLEGNIIEMNGVFGYDIKLDYKRFIKGTTVEGLRYLASEILDSLVCLNKLPKTINDFDKVQFKTDMKVFFQEEGLI